jgi:hypothetical protein
MFGFIWTWTLMYRDGSIFFPVEISSQSKYVTPPTLVDDHKREKVALSVKYKFAKLTMCKTKL